MAVDFDLWTLRDIAQYMKFSVKHVRENIISQDGFPEPIYLTDSKRNPRWNGCAVRVWVRNKA